MLRIIKEGIESQTEIIVMPLYKCILDLHLEYCVHFLSSPSPSQRAIAALGKAQKMSEGFQGAAAVELQVIKQMCIAHSSKETYCGRGLSYQHCNGCGISDRECGRFFTGRLWLSCGTLCYMTVHFLWKTSWKKNLLKVIKVLDSVSSLYLYSSIATLRLEQFFLSNLISTLFYFIFFSS